MARRKKIQLVRPYEDEGAFVEAEGWTIHKRSIVLVGAPEVEIGTEVRCDVALESGHKLIRAEGRVVEHVAPEGDRPGGVKLRIQRVAPHTQEFINRVLSNAAHPVDSVPAASPEPLVPPVAEEPAEPAPGKATEPAPEEPAEPAEEAEPRDAGRKSRRPRNPSRKRKTSDSGMHARVVPPVDPPPNREELLDRLRARQRRRVENGEGGEGTREDAG